ncbi:hypothetical protein tloyanaT_13390 [Thalassotalea loyana]|uniref:Uncharacterized protein n=2 Tax=Thalassotalea loyana TaxID=280483 RepID=A0ABQ6HBV4_9GAMM|nr:hypothetical protein tloyanaT_13390 [Thalassotalea loyana]
MTFASTEELQAARRQWARNFGQISRAQLEKGIERLKREMERGNKTFEWPNIPAFIGLCKQSSPPEHKVFDASKALPAKPWAERQAQATLHIQGIKRSIFKKAAK